MITIKTNKTTLFKRENFQNKPLKGFGTTTPLFIGGGQIATPFIIYYDLFIEANNEHEYNSAFRYLITANNYEKFKRNVNYKNKNNNVDRDNYKQDISIFQKNLFENDYSYNTKENGINYEPIFIIGLHNSGIDLLERILTSNNNIKGFNINDKYFDTDFYQGPKKSIIESDYIEIRNTIIRKN